MGFFPLKKFQISCLSSKLNVSKEQVWVRWGISCQPPKNTDCDATRLRGKEGGKLPKWSIRGKLPLFQLKYGMRQFWESLQCKGDRAGSDSNFVVQKGLILRKKQLKIPIQWSCQPLIYIFPVGLLSYWNQGNLSRKRKIYVSECNSKKNLGSLLPSKKDHKLQPKWEFNQTLFTSPCFEWWIFL